MRRSGVSCVKDPEMPVVLNQTRRSHVVLLKTVALSGWVMPGTVVSPSSTLKRPLLTVSCTALDGSLPATDEPSLDQGLSLSSSGWRI